MRLLALAVGVVLAMTLPGEALCAEMAAGIELGPPVFALERSEVLAVTRSCTVELPVGESVFSLPAAELGVDPAKAELSVEPAEQVRVAAMEIPAGGGAVSWRLVAEAPVEADLQVSYLLKGLTWAIDYVATLRADGGVDLVQNLTVTNGLGRSFEEAVLAGPVSAVMPLRDGETVTRQVLELSIPAEFVRRSYVYDYARHGDAAVELLTIGAEGIALPAPPPVAAVAPEMLPGPTPVTLEPGAVRIYAGADVGGQFIGAAAIPYLPHGEELELNLGPAAGVLVERTRKSAKEANVRKDALNKTALYDMDEVWELTARNLRTAPVELTILEHPEGTWRVMRASTTYEKPDATTLAFTVPLQPGQEQELTWTLRLMNLQP